MLVLRNLHNYTPVFKEIITIDDIGVSFKFTVQKMLSEIVNKAASIVSKETHTTIKIQVYTSDQLHNIGLRSKLTSNYNSFFLEQEVRNKIIELEIRKHP